MKIKNIKYENFCLECCQNCSKCEKCTCNHKCNSKFNIDICLSVTASGLFISILSYYIYFLNTRDN